MTTADLVMRIARQTGLPVKAVRAVFAQLEDEVVTALYQGDSIQLRGIGTMRLHTLERGGRPPAGAVGKRVHNRGIWAYPEFRPAARLKSAMQRRLKERV